MKDIKGAGDFSVSTKEGFSLVDFWAPWCGPCVAMTPLLNQAEELLKEKISFYKVNVEEEQNQIVAAKFQVRGIPMLVILQNGLEKTRKVGAFSSLAQLKDWINSIVDSK